MPKPAKVETEKNQPRSSAAQSFEAAAQQRSQGLLRELVGYLWANKKWWLIPLIIALLGLTALIILGGTGAAPFVYTLF